MSKDTKTFRYKKFSFLFFFGILYVKEKNETTERPVSIIIRVNRGIPRTEQMYDFYFSNYSAYYMCKDKREEKNRRKPGVSLNLISDNQDYQISVHESDFYFSNYFAYYM